MIPSIRYSLLDSSHLCQVRQAGVLVLSAPSGGLLSDGDFRVPGTVVDVNITHLGYSLGDGSSG